MFGYTPVHWISNETKKQSKVIVLMLNFEYVVLFTSTVYWVNSVEVIVLFTIGGLYKKGYSF